MTLRGRAANVGVVARCDAPHGDADESRSLRRKIQYVCRNAGRAAGTSGTDHAALGVRARLSRQCVAPRVQTTALVGDLTPKLEIERQHICHFNTPLDVILHARHGLLKK